MAIWDGQGGGDPMKMLLLASMAQGLGRSLSKSTNTNYYGQQPQGGGGMEEMLPEMMRMQQLQAQMANQNADNELQRRQFEAGQAAAAQKQEIVRQAAAAMGVPEAVALANPDAVVSAWADRLKAQNVAPGHSVVANGQELFSKPALLQMGEGGFGDVERGIFRADPQMTANALGLRKAGATRVTNTTNLTQDTMSTEMAKTPAKRYEELSAAAANAQSALAATRSIYEMAKLAPDLFGPGMTLTAEAEKGIKAAENILAKGGSLDPQQEKLLAIAKAVEVRQTNSAITRLRDIGGNDTEKEYERVKKAIPGLETSLPSQELVFIQEKTAADHLTGLERHVAQRLREAQLRPRDAEGALGLTTTNDAIDEYNRMNPLGDALAKNLQAVMESRGWRTTGTLPGAGADPFADIDPNDPDALVGAYKKAGGR